MKPRSIKALRRDAARFARRLGHRMRWSPVEASRAIVASSLSLSEAISSSVPCERQYGKCSDCGAEVSLATVPSANEIDIGGAGIAQVCAPAPRSHYDAFGCISGSCGHQHRTIQQALQCCDDHSLSLGRYSDRWPNRVNVEGQRDIVAPYRVAFLRASYQMPAPFVSGRFF